MYGPNPFPESMPVAEYIKAHSNKQDEIAVLGSEPQIYFYSNRHSATGYIYMYPLMENQKYALRMQKEMVTEIEKARPLFLIFVNIPYSWLAHPESEKYIFDWFKRYCEDRYSLVGIVDLLAINQTVFRWDTDVINYFPRSPYFLCVYKKSGD